jgi:O-6-methylguanine DNA methyltransferase
MKKGKPTIFAQKVIVVVRKIPKGRVSTYSQVAKLAGSPRAARAVGNLLHQSKGQIPCHRVVNALGKLSSKFALGGIKGQQKFLEKEGMIVKNGKVDLGLYLHR